MKKILLLALTICTMSSMASAQHTIPRYGTSPNSDQTFRGQRLQYVPFSDASGIDTLKLYPNALQTQVSLTVADTVVVYASKASAWRGDRLTIMVSNTAGSSHTIYLLAAGGAANPWQLSSSGATISLTTAKRAAIEFIFDGSVWVELSRMVQ